MFCVYTNFQCLAPVEPATNVGAPRNMKSAGWNFGDARGNFNAARFLGEVSLRISIIRMKRYSFHSSIEYHQILELCGV